MKRDDDLQQRFEEAFGTWKERARRGEPPWGGRGLPRFGGFGRPGRLAILLPILVVLGVIALFSSYYTVQPEEVGVVTRFGRFRRQTEPGLRVKWPWGIEDVQLVRTLEIHKEEFGFRTARPGIKTEYSQKDFDHESLMLTGDLNIADVEWIVQYRIIDPKLYLFSIRNPERALRDASEAVMREVVGDRSVTEVLTSGRIDVDALAQERLQEVLDRYGSGLDVVTVRLQDVTPPARVKPSFNAVNQARQEKEQTINGAWEAFNKVVPLAEGEAQRMLTQAEGYAKERTNRALGDVQRFLSVQAEYAKAPQVTRQRLYLEMVREVLPKLDRKILMDPSSPTAPLPFLNLDGGASGPLGGGR